MNVLPCSLGLVLAVGSALGCAHAPTAETPAVGATTLTSGDPSRSLDDASIAGILRAEFAAAADDSRGVAIAAIDPQLRHYARLVTSANERAFGDEEAILGATGLTTKESSLSRQIAIDSKMAGNDLSARRGIDLERAYLSREVASQTELLRLIDDDLLPAVRSDEMRAEILGLRTTVERLRAEGSILARWLMTEP